MLQMYQSYMTVYMCVSDVYVCDTNLLWSIDIGHIEYVYIDDNDDE